MPEKKPVAGIRAGLLPVAQSARELAAKKYGCKACADLDELLELAPDYVVEVASPGAVKDIAEAVLSAGSNLVLLSIGALADAGFLERVEACARTHGRRVHLASGAIGGFDVLRTAAQMSAIESSITTEKGPDSLRNTAVFSENLLNVGAKREVFAGNARDAIALFPTKVNVAVATALCTAGADATRVSINSTAGFKGDDHRIEVHGEEVHAVVDIYSRTKTRTLIVLAGFHDIGKFRDQAIPTLSGA